MLLAFHACLHPLSPDSQFRFISRLSLSYEKRTNIIDGVEIAAFNTKGVVGMGGRWLVVVRPGWRLFRSPVAGRSCETSHRMMVCRGYHNFGQAFDNQQVQ